MFKIRDLLHAFTSCVSEPVRILGGIWKGLTSESKTSQSSWEIAWCHMLFRLAADNFRREKLSCLLVKWLGIVPWSLYKFLTEMGRHWGKVLKFLLGHCRIRWIKTTDISFISYIRYWKPEFTGAMFLIYFTDLIKHLLI